jgi:hypothetical protein
MHHLRKYIFFLSTTYLQQIITTVQPAEQMTTSEYQLSITDTIHFEVPIGTFIA